MRVFPTCVLVVSACMVARAASTQDGTPLLIDSITDSTARFAVQKAVRDAAQRLECTECGKVLSDFRDASGHAIRTRLDLLGETAAYYLTRITFREAVDHRCQDPTRLAFTYVGVAEVFICGPQFWRKYQEDPRYLEALMIHEMLHTLGLRENPPSSAEISDRVLKRCWSTDCHRPAPK